MRPYQCGDRFCPGHDAPYISCHRDGVAMGYAGLNNPPPQPPLTEADVRRIAEDVSRRIAAEVYREMEGKGRADQA